MEQISEILRMFMVIVGIVQVILGLGAWYLGLQIRMLRLELMSKEACDQRHQKLREQLEEAHRAVTALDARVGMHLNKGA